MLQGSFEVMMICFMVGAPMAVLGTILTAADKVWTVSLVALSGCILNIVCNALFILPMNTWPSWTTFATALFITLLYLWHLRTMIASSSLGRFPYNILPWVLCVGQALHSSINFTCKFLFKVILYLIITSAIIASTKVASNQYFTNFKELTMSQKIQTKPSYIFSPPSQYKGWIIGATLISGIAAVVISLYVLKPYYQSFALVPYQSYDA